MPLVDRVDIAEDSGITEGALQPFVETIHRVDRITAAVADEDSVAWDRHQCERLVHIAAKVNVEPG